MEKVTVRFVASDKPDATIPGDSIGVNQLGFILVTHRQQVYGAFPPGSVAGVFSLDEPGTIIEASVIR